MRSFKERVYDVVAQIPRGKVLTYKEVALRAGNKRACRAVGNILHYNPDAKHVPCHRVIRSDGTVGGYAHGTHAKEQLLRDEGVVL